MAPQPQESSADPRRQAWIHSRTVFLLTLAALFLFRLYYGLSMDFWNDDERQIYLQGLKWLTTGAWPYFGPDVIYTNSQIAGALQALLVGVPLKLLPLPEAPILLINILSFIGLSLLAVYLCRLIPNTPRLFVFVWLFTLPWTLNMSLHVYNPSYLLFSGCLFFVGFGETLPSLKTGLMGEGIAFFLIGFALAWSLQLHLSWPLLVPFIGATVFLNARAGRLRFRHIGSFAGGFALPSLLLLPTLIKYGPQVFLAPLLANSGVNQDNAHEPLTILARFLSFAAYEVPRFITAHSEERLPYLMGHPWLIPLAVVVGLIGLFQPVLFLIGLIRNTTPPAARFVIVLSITEICAAFVMSSRPPTARNYYLLFPVAAMAGLYGMRFLFDTPSRRRMAGIILALGIAYQGMLAFAHIRENSLYSDRARVVAALANFDYRHVGERRPIAPPQH